MLISVFDKLPKDQATGAYLGGKGHGLWWMQQQGVNVPPALIIPTTVCVEYMASPGYTLKAIKAQLPAIKEFFVQKFGFMPLLSVRSGARVSMPGMMDTILNVGLDSTTLGYWTDKLGQACAEDSYQRLITMYGNVVKGVPRDKLEARKYTDSLAAYLRQAHQEFPDADDQLMNSIEAVFDSWNNERAKVYRHMHSIPEEWGTAVVIQSMVFGNLNDNSGTGVLFTRNPDSGADLVVGEFMVNAQGEDVVAGIRTPMPLSQMKDWNAPVADQLLEAVVKLEKAKRDVQDVEFTIQDGQLFILQTRNAKRSARAAVKIALSMLDSKMLTPDEARARVSARELDLADMPGLDPKFKTPPEFTGIPACSGVAVGVIARSSDEAVAMAAGGKSVVLVTQETTPDDIKGMVASAGVLTMTGGCTSHAAVVARSMNRVCVVGLGADYSKFVSGQTISLDGSTGRVWLQPVPVIAGQSDDVEAFRELVVGQGSVLTDSVPKYKAERVVLDLVNHLCESDDEITKLIADTHKVADTLTVMVFMPSEDQMEVLSTFYTISQLEERLGKVRDLVDSLLLSGLGVAGWKSKAHPAIDCVRSSSLADLALATGVAWVIPGNQLKGRDLKAAKKIISWLSKDGHQLTQFNEKGAVAAWTVHVG